MVSLVEKNITNIRNKIDITILTIVDIANFYLNKVSDKIAGVYKVPYNLIFFPTPIFF